MFCLLVGYRAQVFAVKREKSWGGGGVSSEIGYRGVPKVAGPQKQHLPERNVNFRTFLAIPESSSSPESNGYLKVPSIFGLSVLDPL